MDENNDDFEKYQKDFSGLLSPLKKIQPTSMQIARWKKRIGPQANLNQNTRFKKIFWGQTVAAMLIGFLLGTVSMNFVGNSSVLNKFTIFKTPKTLYLAKSEDLNATIEYVFVKSN